MHLERKMFSSSTGFRSGPDKEFRMTKISFVRRSAHLRQSRVGDGATAAMVLYLLSASTAGAYVDPGTGSMLLQLFGAFVAGAIFYFREFRIRLLEFFSRIRGRSAEQPPTDER